MQVVVEGVRNGTDGMLYARFDWLYRHKVFIHVIVMRKNSTKTTFSRKKNLRKQRAATYMKNNPSMHCDDVLFNINIVILHTAAFIYMLLIYLYFKVCAAL